MREKIGVIYIFHWPSLLHKVDAEIDVGISQMSNSRSTLSLSNSLIGAQFLHGFGNSAASGCFHIVPIASWQVAIIMGMVGHIDKDPRDNMKMSVLICIAVECLMFTFPARTHEHVLSYCRRSFLVVHTHFMSILM